MEQSHAHAPRLATHAFDANEQEQDSGGKTMAPPPFQLMASEDTPPADSTPDAKPNNTGLPDNLKTGIESMSGMAMDDIKVHRNSAEPAKMGAHAFAQGSDIHLASGQEQHLPHEAWHVVQQKQGRVQPTTEVGGNAVNDDVSLESEADVMGAKALQMKAVEPVPLEKGAASGQGPKLAQAKFKLGNVAQLARTVANGNITYNTEDFAYNGEATPRERAFSAVINGRSRKNEDAPNQPMSFHNATTGNWDDMDGYHRGHVAARFLGGWHVSYNIVPMLPNFNTGPWANEEANIAREVAAGNAVTIQPNYNATTDERVPNSITVTSTGGYNNTVDHAVPLRAPTTDVEEGRLNTVAATPGNTEHAMAILAKAAEAGMIPANYAASPYLKLDIDWLCGGGAGSPGARYSYKTWQVDQLIRYNKRLNGGNMESDAWGGGTEPHRVLNEDGRKDRPEIDHIVPESRGGANLFCNARVVSWELNNSIERVLDAGVKFTKW